MQEITSSIVGHSGLRCHHHHRLSIWPNTNTIKVILRPPQLEQRPSDNPCPAENRRNKKKRSTRRKNEATINWYKVNEMSILALELPAAIALAVRNGISFGRIGRIGGDRLMTDKWINKCAKGLDFASNVCCVNEIPVTSRTATTRHSNSTISHTTYAESPSGYFIAYQAKINEKLSNRFDHNNRPMNN